MVKQTKSEVFTGSLQFQIFITIKFPNLNLANEVVLFIHFAVNNCWEHLMKILVFQIQSDIECKMVVSISGLFPVSSYKIVVVVIALKDLINS